MGVANRSKRSVVDTGNVPKAKEAWGRKQKSPTQASLEWGTRRVFFEA
jgi:hypothetical protein